MRGRSVRPPCQPSPWRALLAPPETPAPVRPRNPWSGSRNTELYPAMPRKGTECPDRCLSPFVGRGHRTKRRACCPTPGRASVATPSPRSTRRLPPSRLATRTAAGACLCRALGLGRFGRQIFTTRQRLLSFYPPRSLPDSGSPKPSVAAFGCRRLLCTRTSHSLRPPW